MVSGSHPNDLDQESEAIKKNKKKKYGSQSECVFSILKPL